MYDADIFYCIDSAFIFKAHYTCSLGHNGEGGKLNPDFTVASGDSNCNWLGNLQKTWNYNWVDWKWFGFVDEITLQSWKPIRILL